MSSQTDELALLERVFLRIGTADTDEELQNNVGKFLPPVLLKLSSQQDGVRKKVMELLVHINRRIKSRPEVQLPVEALFLQYQDPAATSFVINFTIIYLKLGYPRLSIEKQVAILPIVLNCLEGKPQSHQDSLLLMMIPIFAHVTPPKDPEKRSSLFGLRDKPVVAKMLLDFMMDILLLPYGVASINEQQNAPRTQPGEPTVFIPPGMSEYTFKRVMPGEASFTSEALEQAKVGIVKFLSCGVLPEIDIVPHMVVAASDSRFNVATAGDLELKRTAGISEWNNPIVVNKLYSIFLGTVISKEVKTQVKKENKFNPVGPRIRLRILSYLMKSREAATTFPACIQLIFDCLFSDNTNNKLKDMTLQFVLSILMVTTNDTKLVPVGGILLHGLKKLVAPHSKEEPKIRGLAYIAIGKIGLRMPHLITKDLTVVQEFFIALTEEDKETQQSVQQGFSLMAASFATLEPQELVLMEALISTHIEKPQSAVRHMAVKYAGTIFPTTHCSSRLILLLGVGDIADEICTESSKMLYASVSKEHPDIMRKADEADVLPPFLAMTNCICDRANLRLRNKQGCVTDTTTFPFTPNCCAQILDFLHLCLVHSSGLYMTRDQAKSLKDQSPVIGKYLRELLSSTESAKIVNDYFGIIETFEKACTGATALAYLLECVASVPDLIAANYALKIPWIGSFLLSRKIEVREVSAELYGVITAQVSSESEFDGYMKELISSAKESTLEQQHGAILALGYALGKRVYLKFQNNVAYLMDWQIFKNAIDCIVLNLKDQHNMLITAACVAIGEIGRFSPLPIPATVESDKLIKGKLGIVNCLLQMVKDIKVAGKLRERAALTVGQLCVGDANFPHVRRIMEEFLRLAREIKEIEIHFTMGESLVYCALGPLAPIGRDLWTVSEEDYQKHRTVKPCPELDWLLTQLLGKEYIRNPHPNIKQASSVWLLSLLKYCKCCEELKKYLSVIQSAFMSLLGDSNDVIQDVASKALGLIYDCSSEKERSELVNGLLQTITTGQQVVTNVTSDTKLFEEGELGKSPIGGNLTTYKELCSLASDLNQPDLIYKFMNLANHNAIWNSKKGAAFGFSAIASRSGEQLTEHLPKIIPRLYRYQFDPLPRIQQSMCSIWSALVPETQKTVTLYFHEILSDISTNLTSPQWRTRESCCLALVDLLQGRSFDNDLEFIPSLWETLFRVVDDVKESVRKSADLALKALSKSCVRLCEAGGKAGNACLQILLPVMLKSGLCSSVSEVRAFSLKMIQEIAKLAGPLLKPHLPVLMVALLEATGQSESASLNYLSTRLGAEERVQESLDMARIAVTKSTPTMDTVQTCLQYVDASTLEELIPRVLELTKNSVGLGTKAGCMHVLVYLTTHCNQDIQPYSGKIITVLINCLVDRNAAIRRSAAATIGYVVRVAKPANVEKLISKLKGWYLEKDEEVIQLACAYTFQAIAKQSPDVLSDHGTSILPLALFGKQKLPTNGSDTNTTEDICSIWDDVWVIGTPGTEGGVRLYMKEILEILQHGLESQSWKKKAQAALGMGTVASSLGSQMEPSQIVILLEVLEGGLTGRTWQGKEALLLAIEGIFCNCSAPIKSLLKMADSPILIDPIITSLLRECKKESMLYSKCALKTTSKILEVLEMDRFKDIYDIVNPVINKSSNGRASPDSDKENENLQWSLLDTCYEALYRSWTNSTTMQDEYWKIFLELLVTGAEKNPRSVQMTICLGFRKYIQTIQALRTSPVNNETVIVILDSLTVYFLHAFGMVKYNTLRKEALTNLEMLVNLQKERGTLELLNPMIRNLDESLHSLCNDTGNPEMQHLANSIKNTWLVK